LARRSPRRAFLFAIYRYHGAAGFYSKPLLYNAPLVGGPSGPAIHTNNGDKRMDWLISSAYAQAAPAQQGSPWMSMLPLVLIFVVFYFLLIRPQTKRAKEHQAMIKALEVGTEVATSGGIIGKITEVGDQFLTIEIADSVQVKVQRHTVSQVLPKGTVKSA
jgi:preprotein translocase subunit YajC